MGGFAPNPIADTESWEQKATQTLKEMDEVFANVKNQDLDFTSVTARVPGVSGTTVRRVLFEISANATDVMRLVVGSDSNRE